MKMTPWRVRKQNGVWVALKAHREEFYFPVRKFRSAEEAWDYVYGTLGWSKR